MRSRTGVGSDDNLESYRTCCCFFFFLPLVFPLFFFNFSFSFYKIKNERGIRAAIGGREHKNSYFAEKYSMKKIRFFFAK